MLDVISIGTISIDLYYKGSTLSHSKDRFELAIGGKYFVDYFYEGLGGGGSNVAIGMSKLGLRVGLIARIGDNPFRSIITSKLDDSHVRHTGLCHTQKGYWNVSSILLNSNGERTIINYRTDHQQIFDHAHEQKRLLAAKAIYLASLSQVPLEERTRILRFSKLHDVKTIANLNVTDCRLPIEKLSQFLPFVDVLIVNTHELGDMVKIPCERIDFHDDITNRFPLLDAGLVLVVTDGKKGSFTYHNHQVYHTPSITGVQVVDTTGAGDGYTAGFIASYLSHGDIKEAMRNGTHYASTILTHIGAN